MPRWSLDDELGWLERAGSHRPENSRDPDESAVQRRILVLTGYLDALGPSQQWSGAEKAILKSKALVLLSKAFSEVPAAEPATV